MKLSVSRVLSFLSQGIRLAGVAVILAGAFTLLPLSPAQSASGDRVALIRDAEIEDYLRRLATPLYRAAELDPGSVTIAIIQNSDINAFVAGGMNEFFYTGLLQMVETPDQLAGVIAHETGHIAGGHLIRGGEAMENASAEAIIGMLVGVAAGLFSHNGKVAMGAISGAQNIAERNILSFSRAQESSADAAGLSFLDRAGMSCQGMLEFMQKLAGQELLPIDRQSEYVRTHPLTQDRIDAIKNHLARSPYANAKLDPSFYVMHERMKAKLLGFLQPEMALLRYTDKDPRVFARYARSIALYRTSHLDRALPIIDGLLKEEPKQPFFYELKAQMLFENGHVEEAVGLYQKAVDLAPSSALLRIAYAHALLESKVPGRVDPAIAQLTEANRLESRLPEVWRFLAVAWGHKAEASQVPADAALVSYALAEQALAQGNDREAAQYADRALKALPKGSPYWLRAQDIKLSGPVEDRK